MPESAPAKRPLVYDTTDYIIIAAIMGLMGAFFWAIRGTTGYGGWSGGTLAGLGWAMLWMGFSHYGGDGAYRPYGTGRMVAAITLGIAVGGMTGYGAYISWLSGVYQMHHHEVTREIAPWTGYAMLFVCGIHWGGVTGAFMAWAAPKPAMSWTLWIPRILAGVVGWYVGSQLVNWIPQFILPYYGEGYYEMQEYATSQRVLRSAPNVLSHVGLFVGFLLFEVARRDWRAVKIMLVMSLGFAIPFMVGGYWQTMHGSELAIDWWKNWEMTIGLGGGLAFGLAFYLFNGSDLEVPRPVTKQERLVGVGLILWLAVGTVLLGAYEGFINLHDLKESLESTRPTAAVAYYLLGGIAFALWIARTVRLPESDLADRHATPLPLLAVPIVLGCIVVAGYLTSVPSDWGLNNKVLVTLYTLYISASIALCIALRKRQQI